MTTLNQLPAAHFSEIDLVALAKDIWRQKNILVVCGFMFALVAAAYAYLSTPTYSVNSVLRPAALNELDALNRTNLYSLTPQEALLEVAGALNSYEVRLGFFQSNPALMTYYQLPGLTAEQGFQRFNRDVLLVLPDPKKSDALSPKIELQLTYPQGVDGVSIVNGLVGYAISQERAEIEADMEVIVRNRIKELEDKLSASRAVYQIDKNSRIARLLEADSIKHAQLVDELKALRAQLKARRADRIAELSEAIQIASSLGIKRPTTPSALGASESGAAVNVLRTEVTNQTTPLYFMGSDALEAEKKALLRRVSDDFAEPRIAQINKELQLLRSNREVEVLKSRRGEDDFLKDTEAMNREMVRLKSLDIDLARLKLAVVDRQAVEPVAPIKPKKGLVVILGLLLGLAAGVLIVSIRHLMARSHSFVHSGVTRLDSLDKPGIAPVVLPAKV